MIQLKAEEQNIGRIKCSHSKIKIHANHPLLEPELRVLQNIQNTEKTAIFNTKYNLINFASKILTSSV